MDQHKTQQKLQENKIPHYLLTNDTNEMTKQFPITGTMNGASEERDRKT